MPGPTATAGVVSVPCSSAMIEPSRQRRAAPLLPSLSKEGILPLFHRTWRRDAAVSLHAALPTRPIFTPLPR